jgi:tRNA dimethylallyltransferase
LEQAIDEIKKNTRRYAKRQLTWFKKDVNIHWVSPETSPKSVLTTFFKD